MSSRPRRAAAAKPPKFRDQTPVEDEDDDERPDPSTAARASSRARARANPPQVDMEVDDTGSDTSHVTRGESKGVKRQAEASGSTQTSNKSRKVAFRWEFKSKSLHVVKSHRVAATQMLERAAELQEPRLDVDIEDPMLHIPPLPAFQPEWNFATVTPLSGRIGIIFARHLPGRLTPVPAKSSISADRFSVGVKPTEFLERYYVAGRLIHEECLNGAIRSVDETLFKIHWHRFDFDNLHKLDPKFEPRHVEPFRAFIVFLVKFQWYWANAGACDDQIGVIRHHLLRMANKYTTRFQEPTIIWISSGSRPGFMNAIFDSGNVATTHTWAQITRPGDKSPFAIAAFNDVDAKKIAVFLTTLCFALWDQGEAVTFIKLLSIWRQGARTTDFIAGATEDDRRGLLLAITQRDYSCSQPRDEFCDIGEHWCPRCETLLPCSVFAWSEKECYVCRDDQKSPTINYAHVSGRNAVTRDAIRGEYAQSTFKSTSDMMRDLGIQDAQLTVPCALTKEDLCLAHARADTATVRPSVDSAAPHALHPSMTDVNGDLVRVKHCEGNIVVTSQGLNLARQRQSFVGLRLMLLGMAAAWSNALINMSNLVAAIQLVSEIDSIRPLYETNSPEDLLVILLAHERVAAAKGFPMPVDWPGTVAWLTAPGRLYAVLANTLSTKLNKKADDLIREAEENVSSLATNVYKYGGRVASAYYPSHHITHTLNPQEIDFCKAFVQNMHGDHALPVPFKLVENVPSVVQTCGILTLPEMLKWVLLRATRARLECNYRWYNTPHDGLRSKTLIDWFLFHMIFTYGPHHKDLAKPRCDDLFGTPLLAEEMSWFKYGLHHRSHYQSMALGVSVEFDDGGNAVSGIWSPKLANISVETQAANGFQGAWAADERTANEARNVITGMLKTWAGREGGVELASTFPVDGNYRSFPPASEDISFVLPMKQES